VNGQPMDGEAQRESGGVATTQAFLLAPATTYRADDFLAAADRLGLAVTVVSDRCHQLAPKWAEADASTPHRAYYGSIPAEMDDLEQATMEIAALAREKGRVVAVLGVDDATSVIATGVCALLGLRHNPIAAVATARDKGLMRAKLAAAGVSVPRFFLLAQGADPRLAGEQVGYPCVAKPIALSASRGVIRADGPDELVAAVARIRRLLAEPDLAHRRHSTGPDLLIERFIPGREVALEALLRGGKMLPLALFDKPDPMNGPFFEESLYITPSRLSSKKQRSILRSAARAVEVLGLREGPIHAEFRFNDEGPWVLEVAARSIGGLCSRTLRFGLGITLEELILRHALGLELPSTEREHRAAGVLMLSIPRAGILHQTGGLAEARAVPNVEDVTITVREGDRLVPWPEGNRYPGFAFARAETPHEVEAALRQVAHLVHFDLGPDLPRA
jgi:biotin carboxylase